MMSEHVGSKLGQVLSSRGCPGRGRSGIRDTLMILLQNLARKQDVKRV